MANFCCSIEMEPRTLNQGQLHLAREVAVDIVQNNVPQEAATTFIEGLKPMVTTLENALIVQAETNGTGVDNKNTHEDDNNGFINDNNKVAGQYCLCSTKIVESPDNDQSKVKEPFTAPF